MTASTGKRSYRACDRCRRRKIRCDLTSVGGGDKSPCSECRRSGNECTLPPSRRGGDYSRYRKGRTRQSPRLTGITEELSQQNISDATTTVEGIVAAEHIDTSNSQHDSPEGEPIRVDELRNPSDALQILARTTSLRENESNDHDAGNASFDVADGQSVLQQPSSHNAGEPRRRHPALQTGASSQSGVEGYKLVAQGFLDRAVMQRLIQIYSENYHDFVPLVPRHFLDCSNIDHVAEGEPFLLTVILTIASKDDEVWHNVHRRCWDHMQELLLDVLLARPHTHRIGLVEGLLLLSDWLPSACSHSSSSSKVLFAEDATAWSLIGQAVRHAYLLRLDRTSFREEIRGETKEDTDRKRLVWTFVYLADRQISVRLGQAFWSRGPSLSSKFTAKDFPTLKPSSPDEDDQASVLQATMELTQLLHNAHDILYSSQARTRALILAGDYNRYLDDFQKALFSWHETWDNLQLTSKTKCVLRLMYEYLCLYVNAFAFQARVALMANEARLDTIFLHSTPSRQHTAFPRGIMATPEGRYIFEAFRAAKAVLKVMGQTDPISCLRYMPTRYYLYTIYSAVFLYKANSFGSFPSNDEREEVAKLVQDFAINLEQAATTEEHVAWRYSRLLGGLCFLRNDVNTSSSKHPGVMRTSRRPRQSGFDNISTGTNARTAPCNLANNQPSSTPDGRVNANNYTSILSETSATPYLDALSHFDSQNMQQTDSLLEALFGVDNINFVPPFSEEIMF